MGRIGESYFDWCMKHIKVHRFLWNSGLLRYSFDYLKGIPVNFKLTVFGVTIYKEHFEYDDERLENERKQALLK